MTVIQPPARLAEIGERGLGELLEILSSAKARKADLDRLIAARDEANEAIKANNTLAAEAAEAQTTATADYADEQREIREARTAMEDESQELDAKRHLWNEDEAGGKATIERQQARIDELEAEAREVARQRAAFAEFRERL